MFGEEIKVIESESLKRCSCFGEAHYRYNEILIDNSIDEKMKENTFLHEITHFALQKMGESNLCDNEKFVSVFSSLLHQSLEKCLK